MRIHFSSTKGTGNLTPLLPYLNRLLKRGNEVKVAAPHHLARTLRKAGIAHAEFGYPEVSTLDAIWAAMAGLTRDQINAIAIERSFARAVRGVCPAQAS